MQRTAQDNYIMHEILALTCVYVTKSFIFRMNMCVPDQFTFTFGRYMCVPDLVVLSYANLYDCY